mgnify:CR=1 FL=1
MREFIPENLVRIRTMRGFTARRLSLLLKKNPSYINSIENGKVSVSIKSIHSLSNILKISPEYFFIPQETNIHLFELLFIIERLNDNNIIILLKLAEALYQNEIKDIK